jgi:hypothetical protein
MVIKDVNKPLLEEQSMIFFLSSFHKTTSIDEESVWECSANGVPKNFEIVFCLK